MIIEDFGKDINEFDNLLQKITTDMASGVIFERLQPPEIWNRSESSVSSLQNLSKKIRETMLLFKPEKAPIIEKGFKAILSPLNAFKETLFQKSDDPVSNARLALEQFRKSVTEGFDFLRLAKDIESHPSEAIIEVLRLREVYASKDYLSAVLAPEAVHARFMVLKKQLESLRLHMSSLEKDFEDIRAHMDIVEEEIRKFLQSPTALEEASEKKEGQGEVKPAVES